jgi:hypothetical protein
MDEIKREPFFRKLIGAGVTSGGPTIQDMAPSPNERITYTGVTVVNETTANSDASIGRSRAGMFSIDYHFLNLALNVPGSYTNAPISVDGNSYERFECHWFQTVDADVLAVYVTGYVERLEKA